MNCHTVLPSAAAAVLSVGVVTRNNGDLAEGEGVSRRIVALGAGGAWEGALVDEEGWLKGKLGGDVEQLDHVRRMLYGDEYDEEEGGSRAYEVAS